MAVQPFTAAFDYLKDMGCKAYLHQLLWTALKRLPALTDPQAVLTDSQAVLTDSQAVLTDSPTVPGQTGKESCTLTDH